MNVLTYGNDAQLVDDEGDLLVDDDDEILGTAEPEITLVWGTGSNATLLTWPDPEPEDD